MVIDTLLRYKINLFLVVLLCAHSLYGITIVYNFRIAETTRSHLKTLIKRRKSIIALTTFAQFRKLLKEVHQSAVGGLLNYVYMKEDFYARISSAIAHVRTKTNNTLLATPISRTQTDDILFTAGYALTVHERLKVAFSGHFGIPTHKDTSLQALQFGTGHVGLGGQIDGVLHFNEHQALMAAVRFIHFFSRDVPISIDDVIREVDFSPGNVADLFFSYQHVWKSHQIECGYNPTFIFDARLSIPLPLVIEEINSTTHSFFASYRYGFLIRKTYPSAFIIGTSIGTNPQPESIGNTTIVTAWLSWGINF